MRKRVEKRSGLVGLAEEVRDFYERYPYPRPIESLDKYRRLWQDRQRRRADYHLFWPDRPYREDQSILVAGCGTSQAAKHALRWPAAQVTGIDFSATSVHHTEELKRKYNLNNLKVHQLPIERAQDLESSFDQIVCTGVLHHMAEPDAGLKALRDVLKPDGAMHLMVYATYGRVGIYMLQEYCRMLEIDHSEDEIQDLADTLMNLSHDHPLARLLGGSPDFRSKAGLADALLHPQDRAYTVPELFDFIRQGGLVFGRWLWQAAYLPQCGAIVDTPHALRLAQLPIEDQYAAVELFRGTMVRHSVVAYRNDCPGEPRPIRFDDGHWQNYVPIRLPTTVSIQESLPTGAAAVLINKGHVYTDLFLPIDQREKQLFDAIDGHRTIVDVARSARLNKSDWDLARRFFERLWWYDQVVFDVSDSGIH
jgi:SAM-dependent methyltransferase